MTLGIDVLAAVLSRLQGILVTVSIVTMMAAMGTRMTPGDVRRTTREYNLVSRWVLANLVVVPLFAVFFSAVFGIGESILLGLLLVAVAPGAPFIPQLVALAGEDSQEAVRFTAALTVVATVTVPLLVAGALAVLDAETGFSPWRFLLPLLLVLVVPLVIGLAVRARWPAAGARVGPRLFALSNAALLAALVIVVVLDTGAMLRALAVLFGTGALLVIALFVLVTIGIGWLAGSPDPKSRRILALGTAGRNVNVALFIAVTAFPERNADASIVVFAVLMFAVSVGVALYWQRHPRSGATTAGGNVPDGPP